MTEPSLSSGPKIMPAPARGAMHIVVAAATFFCFQHFILVASLQTSLIWALAGGLGAAYLAWSQHRRGH